MNGTKDSRSHNFLLQGGILAIAGIIVRFIGMLYRVPLTSLITDRGNSLYDTAYSAYSIILIISSYSLPVAVSKMIAAKNARGEYRNAYRTFRCSLWYAMAVGLLAAILCYGLAPWLVEADGAVPVLRVLAPVIFFSALLGTFRGLFQGQGTMIPTSISQIIEQILNAIVSIVAAYLLVRPYLAEDAEGMRPIRGAMGSTLGTGAGVVGGLLFVGLIYLMYRPQLRKRAKKRQTTADEPYGQILKTIIWTVTPMVLSATLYNISPFIDNNLIYKIMGSLGETQEAIGNMHGIYTGKYLLMVNIPVAIANALSSAMLPDIAAAKARGDSDGILTKAQMTVKVTMLIAIPCTIGLTVLGGSAVQMIFGGNSELYPTLARDLFRYGSSFVLFFSMSTVTNALLQATDNLKYPVLHSIVALVIHVGLACLLLFCGGGVWALMISTVAFAFVLCILNAGVLRRRVGFRLDWKETIGKPLLVSVLMGIVCWCSYYIFYYFTEQNTLSFLIAFALGLLTYTVALFLFNAVTEAEVLHLPKGAALVRILHRLHLLEERLPEEDSEEDEWRM